MALLDRLRARMGQGKAAPAHGAESPGAEPRVLVFTEHFNATYFISFDAPLRGLNGKGRASFRAYSQQDVAAAGGGWVRWLDDFRPDVVVLTRFGAAQGPQIVRESQSRGLPVVYHIDDDLLHLPESLGEEIVRRQGAAVQARREMLGACDLIYASTAELARMLRHEFPGKPVMQGMYAAWRDLAVRQGPAATPDTIGYMGSKGHCHDLELVVPALVQLMEQRPQLRFETFGTIEMPHALRRFGPRVCHHPVQKSYDEFLRSLARLEWTVGLAPLVDEPFNRCKAPTKFIEYTSCGIPTVASGLAVYADAIPAGAGVLVGDEWKGPLERILDFPDRRVSMLDAARRHCMQAFSPERLESQVEEVLREAMRQPARNPTGDR